MLDLKTLAMAQQDYIIAMRREFHRTPEVSGQEQKTRAIILRELDAMGVPYELCKGTGVLARIEGARPGPCIALRADMDALPVTENHCNLAGEKAVLSEVQGVCHACGHDAHMAMLLGTMKALLSIKDELAGTVLCCFEEGEEIMLGLRSMQEAIAPYPVEEFFALHVYTGLESGKINIDAGPRMAGTIGIDMLFRGRSGHGSRPDLALNPIVPAAPAVSELYTVFKSCLNAEETVTLGICVFQGGQFHNVVPETTKVQGSSRFFNRTEAEKAYKIICRVAETQAEVFGCSVEFSPMHTIVLPPVVNDPGVAARMRNTLETHLGPDVLGACDRWYASDCYGVYLQKWPGVYGFLGIRNEEKGSGAPHHSPEFDVDESVLWLGTAAELGFVLDR